MTKNARAQRIEAMKVEHAEWRVKNAAHREKMRKRREAREDVHGYVATGDFRNGTFEPRKESKP